MDAKQSFGHVTSHALLALAISLAVGVPAMAAAPVDSNANATSRHMAVLLRQIASVEVNVRDVSLRTVLTPVR